MWGDMGRYGPAHAELTSRGHGGGDVVHLGHVLQLDLDRDDGRAHVTLAQVERVAQCTCGGALGHAVALDHVHAEGDPQEVLDGVREGGAPRDHGVAAVEAELRRDLAEDETVPQAVRERAVRVEVGQLGGLLGLGLGLAG